MKVSFYKLLFLLLAILPFSPKIELIQGVRIFPQDILLLPFAIIFVVTSKNLKFLSFTKPFFYLLIALFILLLTTAFSFFTVVDVVGFVKTIKYIFYVILLIAVSRYHFNDFVSIFNKIALITTSLTFFIYIADFISFQGTVSAFFQESVWDPNLIPTGLYNLVYSFPEGHFYGSGGTHGIYGSYLTLVFFINYHIFFENKKVGSISFVLLIFSLLGILLLTSRETFLILMVLIFSLAFKDIGEMKIRRSYLYVLASIGVLVFLLIYFEINIGILNKIQYTISSLNQTGTEGNVQVRFVLWSIIIGAIIANPLYLLIGTGYNMTNYHDILRETATQLGVVFPGQESTESFFFLFLIYGGIFSFIFAMLFWWSLISRLKPLIWISLWHYLFFFLTLALIVTNNIGGSMLSDMFMVQYGLVYLWLVKSVQINPAISNGK